LFLFAPLQEQSGLLISTTKCYLKVKIKHY
jgi:hypothetical protein